MSLELAEGAGLEMNIDAIPEIITWPVAAVIIALMALPILWRLASIVDRNLKKLLDALEELKEAQKNLPENIKNLEYAASKIAGLTKTVDQIRDSASVIQSEAKSLQSESLWKRLNELIDELEKRGKLPLPLDRRSVAKEIDKLVPSRVIDQTQANAIGTVFSGIKALRRKSDSSPETQQQAADLTKQLEALEDQLLMPN